MINITTPKELDDLAGEHDNLLLIFTQPSWCVPCQRLEPHLKAAEDKIDIPFVIIGEEADPLIAKSWSVMGVPSLIHWDVLHGKYYTVQARTSVKLIAELNR